MTDYAGLVDRMRSADRTAKQISGFSIFSEAADAIERLVAERKEWNATITAERERMDRLVEQIAAERDALRDALDFCGSLASEELPYHQVGTAAEAVLRHISKRACAALSEEKHD